MSKAISLINKYQALHEAEIPKITLDAAGPEKVIETTFLHGHLYIQAVYISTKYPVTVAFWNVGMLEYEAARLGIKAGMGCRVTSFGSKLGVYVMLPSGKQVQLNVGSRHPDYTKEVDLPDPDKTSRENWTNTVKFLFKEAGIILYPLVLAHLFKVFAGHVSSNVDMFNRRKGDRKGPPKPPAVPSPYHTKSGEPVPKFIKSRPYN